MEVTTSEFERRLNDFLGRMGNSKRCEWCGDIDEGHIGRRSKLCDSCKVWRRRERRALEWKQKFPNRDEEGLRRYEYWIQYAALCRAAGTLSCDGPISPLDLEREIEALTERFFGESVFGCSATFLFGQFSSAQRRLLKYMFLRMTRVWLRHHRRGFAIEKVIEKAFPRRKPYGDG